MHTPLPFIALMCHEDGLEQLQRELHRSGWQPHARRLDSIAGLHSVLAGDRPCFLAIDASFDSESIPARVKAARLVPDLPVLVLCDPDRECDGVEAMDAGADDYLLKNRLQRLAPLVRRWSRRAGLTGRFQEGDAPGEPDLASEVYAVTSDCIAFFEVRSFRRFVLVRLNPAAERTFGLSSADAVGKTIHEIWTPEVADLFLHSFQTAIASPSTTTSEHSWPTPSGERSFHAVLLPIRSISAGQQTASGDSAPPAHRLAVVWRDITDRKAFEQALCDREEMFRRLVETTNVIPWEADLQSRRFTYIGPQAIKRFGFPAADWYREGFWGEHIHPDDRTHAANSRLGKASSAGEYEFEYRMLTRAGEVVWVHDLVNVVLDKNNRLLLRGFLVDVTARRQAEGEVRRLNDELEQRVSERTRQLALANKELEAFCYSVSHDLRAPLRAIDGFSKALLEDCADRLDDDGRDALGRVRAASQRMGELIDDLLTLSRVSRGEMHRGPVALSELAWTIIAGLENLAPGRKVDWVIAPGLSAVGDSALLRVLLENLLGNAWKYTSRQARARIEFGRHEEGAFFVRDDGAGFDPVYAGKLFQPFQRLHRADEFEGHGIGLATAQRIIYRHGGRVWAEGAVNAGATISFTL